MTSTLIYLSRQLIVLTARQRAGIMHRTRAGTGGPMIRLWIALVTAVAALALGATPAAAAPRDQPSQDLSRLWTTVLETPASENPFVADGCFLLGRTLIPFAAASVDSCAVKPGTSMFLIASSVECSSFEGDHGTFGTTPAELRRCAKLGDLQEAPSIAVDGKQLRVAEVETPVLHIVLPADNLFGLPAGSTGDSVGHGWAVEHHPLSVGSHAVTITSADGSLVIHTTVTVRPAGHQR